MRLPRLLAVAAPSVLLGLVAFAQPSSAQPNLDQPALLRPGTAVAAIQPGRATTAASAPATSQHFLTNLDGARSAPSSIGFNLFDTGASASQVNALPNGVRAVVWVGQKCPTPADKAFKSKVRSLANNAKVFAWYLSDEPHVRSCPGGPAALASRASYIREVTEGRQRSFIVLTDEDYHAFRPRVTKVSMIGIDAYPCSIKGCDFSKIRSKVTKARSAGVWLKRIVPVYQAFGQEDATDYTWYLQPSADQTRTLLATWAAVVPSPQMDYTYGWSNQSSANPTLVDSPDLQAVYRESFD